MSFILTCLGPVLWSEVLMERHSVNLFLSGSKNLTDCLLSELEITEGVIIVPSRDNGMIPVEWY